MAGLIETNWVGFSTARAAKRYFFFARLAGSLILLLLTAGAREETANVVEPRIAILGNPDHQDAWTDAALERLKSIGFNEIQINMAWGPRPFDEALNLADVVTVQGESELPGTAQRRRELQRRVGLAHRHGLRTLFSFASPYTNFNPNDKTVTRGPRILDETTADSWYDVGNPKVRAHEVALLQQFRHEFPDVDDILVYTYDNDAWQTPEFQYGRYSYGVPLADRLPNYLSELHRVWTAGRTGYVRTWWEPWELSAGQVYEMVPKLPRDHFGLIVHSNIAEAQLAAPVDVWVRNTARMCHELGLPMIVESFFSSSSEELEPLSIPAPRLVDEEYLAFTGVPGVVGIKEYYGIDVSMLDPDVEVLQARLHSPNRSTAELLQSITQRYGRAQQDVRSYLELLSEAIEVYPWDASWYAREVGRASIDHGWSAATVQGASWPTPAWESTRHARFMKTDNSQPPFWMLEDVQLRCAQTAEALERATVVYGHMERTLPNDGSKQQFGEIQHDVAIFRQVARSYELHLRETNVAQMLRQDLEAGRPLTATLVAELGRLLAADVENQSTSGRVVEMQQHFESSPTDFVRHYLLPTDQVHDEKGFFSLTTR